MPEKNDLSAIVAFRRALHAHPDLSGDEESTAGRIVEFFAGLSTDEVLTGLGGHGVAIVFAGSAPGPTILLRAELDALPINEVNNFEHRSVRAGCSHKCGHDGHMAILAGVGNTLADRRPPRGRVVLLFQPAEETGTGASAVIADSRFDQIRPDLVFGLHNVPGHTMGQVILRSGTFTCASRGLRVGLSGRSAHAAQPETGNNPAAAMAQLVAQLGSPPADLAGTDELMFVTIVGANVGGANFGVVPDRAVICATLRSETDATMARLVDWCEAQVRCVSGEHGLQMSIDYEDVFDATVNASGAVDIVRRACEGVSLAEASVPFRWSEDFGHFTRVTDGAFFGLGAGERGPSLHNNDYDFPDELIETGSDVFLRIVDLCLTESAP